MTDTVLEAVEHAPAPTGGNDDFAAGRDDAEDALEAARPGGLPEKFWDEESNSLRTEALVKSYNQLERKLGGQSDADVPEGADGYDITAEHGLFTADAEVNAKLHAAGFTQDQAQLVYDMAAEHMLPMITDLATQFEADHQIGRLVQYFGGEEKWGQVSRQLAHWGKSHFPVDVFQSLSSTYDGVLALHRMMAKGEPGLSGAADATAGAVSEGSLKELMRDPRYWRQGDPALVARVREGFRNLYPD